MKDDDKLVSQLIRERIVKAGDRYFANDNISDHIRDGELDRLIGELEEQFKKVLSSLIIDKKDPNSEETPKRLAKMYVEELFEGRYQPQPRVASFPNDGSDGRQPFGGMLVIRAELKSVCSHHHQTTSGIAYIGIIPKTKVIGLSKYIRLAQHCARRGTLQEELCNDIAETISIATGSSDVGVHIGLTHGCCENRGVSSYNSLTQTTVLNGMFYISSIKEEFLKNIQMQQGSNVYK